MFKYAYKMNVVNPEKNIITLSPTAGTWAKAFAPMLLCTVPLIAMAIYSAVTDRNPAPVLDEDDLES